MELRIFVSPHFITYFIYMRKTLSLGIALFLIAGQVFAQRTQSLGDKNYLGFEAGLNYTGYMGAENFFIAFHNPFLSDPSGFYHIPLDGVGSGLGFQLGATLDINIAKNFAFMGKVLFRNHNTSYEDRVDFMCPDVVTGIPGEAVFGNFFDASYNFLATDLLLRAQIQPNGIYGLLGFGFSNMLSNSVSLSQEIVSSTNDCSYTDDFGLRTGETQMVAADNAEQEDFFESFAFGPKIGLGTFIPLGNSGAVLTPELSAYLPLSEWLTDNERAGHEAYAAANGMPKPTAPSMWYMSLTVGIKFPWGGSSTRTIREGQPETVLAGRVLDRKTNAPLDDADVTIVDLSTNEEVDNQNTNENGTYGIVLYPGRYSVTASKDEYMFNSTYFEVNKDGKIVKGNPDIYLEKPPAKIRLLVFFDFNKADLTAESNPELRRALKMMDQYPRMEVEIAGHTDNVGSDQYNKELSQQRANAVRSYLTANGIDASRLSAVGYGEAQPIDSNENEDGRAANRRVEFIVKNM